jgi:hypothetical protein
VTDQNTTHSPRVDDQLAHETAALTHGAPDDGRQEWRRDQVDDETEAVVDRGAEDAELDERSRLAATLVPSAFPATGAVLADIAEAQHANPARIEALRSLPEGRVYQTFAEVWVDLGGAIEQER